MYCVVVVQHIYDIIIYQSCHTNSFINRVNIYQHRYEKDVSCCNSLTHSTTSNQLFVQHGYGIIIYQAMSY